MATSTQEWIDELKSISVLELSERIKALEEEFGVSATAVAAAAPAGGGGGGPTTAPPRRSRRRSTSSSPAPATRRSRSSRSSARRPAWASRRPRRSSTRPPSPSRRASSARRPTSSRPSSRRPAPPSRSSRLRADKQTFARGGRRPPFVVRDELRLGGRSRRAVLEASCVLDRRTLRIARRSTQPRRRAPLRLPALRRARAVAPCAHAGRRRAARAHRRCPSRCGPGRSTPASGSTRRSRSGSPRTTPARSRRCCARTARRRCTTCCCTAGWRWSATARPPRARCRWSSRPRRCPRHGGRRAPRGGRGIVAICPFLTYYAQEARMYTLVAVLSLVATAAFVRRRPVVLVVALTLLLYTHTWGVFLFAAFALVWLVRDRGRGGLLVGAAVAVLYLPWVPSLVFQALHTGAPWSHAPVGPLPRARGARRGVAAARRARPRGRRRASRWPGSPRSSSRRGRRGTCSCSSVRCCSCSRAGRRGPWSPRSSSAPCCSSARPSPRATPGRSPSASASSCAPGDLVVCTQPEQVPVLHRYLPRRRRAT